MRRAAWILGAPIRLVLLGAIHLYRLTFAAAMGGQCRFHPSCSEYGLGAIRTHGALKGAALTAWRVLRCSPLTAGGIDPVPARGRIFVRRRHTREAA